MLERNFVERNGPKIGRETFLITKPKALTNIARSILISVTRIVLLFRKETTINQSNADTKFIVMRMAAVIIQLIILMGTRMRQKKKQKQFQLCL